jgi:hemolysin activation/secretion protein
MLGGIRPWALWASVVACAFCVPCSAVRAQDVPASVDPGRQTGLPSAPETFPDIEPYDFTYRRARAPELSEDMAKARFVLKTLTIEGARAFPPDRLQAFYQADIGREITVARLFDILTAIQQLYQDTGYTISKVFMPEQDIQAGHVTFRVIEGYAATVDIDPALPENSMMGDFAERVLAMRPLNTLTLERLMLILNDRPGMSVGSIIAAADASDALTAGAVKIILKPLDAPSGKNGFVMFDTHGSNFTGIGRTSAGYNVSAGLPSASDLDVFITQTTSNQEMKQAYVGYHLPVCGASGAMINLSVNMTRTQPGGSLDDLDVEGRSTHLAADITYPLIRQREETLTLRTGLDYKNTQTNLLHDRLFEDRTRSLYWGARYSFSDSLWGMNAIDLAYHKGLDFLNVRPTGSVDLSRAEGESDFKKATLSLTRLQTITPRVDVLGTIRGQYAWTPLLSSEEFGFGGNDMGRGYDPSEITGDRGLSALVELRYKNTVRFMNEDRPYQLYLSYDIGKVWNTDPSAKDKFSAASAGAGVRLNLTPVCALDFGVGMPLTKSADEPPKYSGHAQPRALISLRYQF